MLNPRFFKILRCPVPRNYHFFSRDSHTFCFVFMHSHISPNVIQFHYFFFISFNYVHTSISRGIFHFMGNYHQDKSVESIRHQHPGKATSKNLAPTHTQNFGVSLGLQNITKAISTKCHLSKISKFADSFLSKHFSSFECRWQKLNL